MKNFFKFTRNNIFSLLISVLIFLLVSILYKETNLFDGIENGSINFRFYLRNPARGSEALVKGARMSASNEKINKDILIVGIDEDTINGFDDMGIRWPFPWHHYAKVTDYLSTASPEAIFYDIMFLEHKKTIELEDFIYELNFKLSNSRRYSKENIINIIKNLVNELQRKFPDSIKNAKNVFVDYLFYTEKPNTKYKDLDQRIKELDKFTFDLVPEDNENVWVEDLLPPIPSIIKATKGVGYANVMPDKDMVNRSIPLLIKFKDKYYPSIVLLLIMNHYGITKNDIEIKNKEYIKLKNIPPEKMTVKNDKNEITIPINKHGKMLINFIGGQGTFTSIPFIYFYQDGKMNAPEPIKDKILLLAAYGSEGIAHDLHESPVGKLFGIEHIAHGLNTILNQDFLIELSENQNIIILLIISLLIGFFIPRLKIMKATIFTFIFGLSYFIGAYYAFDVHNIISVFGIPQIQIASTFTLIIVLRVMTEQKEKKYIRQTFSKFVSKSVVDELLRSPEKIKLGGERKVLTVLFSDIRGFTTISEQLSPEELVDLLNEYLQSMTDIVIKYQGTLDKYVGDEIMAFWGAPIPQADHPLLACKAAIEMMEVLDKLNKDWEAIGKPRLDIGIGINSGDMIVGNMGSHSRMDYTLMGDNVNLGARLEGTNKVYKTHIIINENTYKMVKDHAIVRELDLIRVKGKEKPVTIYELIDIV